MYYLKKRAPHILSAFVEQPTERIYYTYFTVEMSTFLKGYYPTKRRGDFPRLHNNFRHVPRRDSQSHINAFCRNCGGLTPIGGEWRGPTRPRAHPAIFCGENRPRGTSPPRESYFKKNSSPLPHPSHFRPEGMHIQEYGQIPPGLIRRGRRFFYNYSMRRDGRQGRIRCREKRAAACAVPRCVLFLLCP